MSDAGGLRASHRPQLDLAELGALFTSVGWVDLTMDRYAPVLENSWWWTAVRDDAGALVGFCRVLSDGVYQAYLCNMAVRESGRAAEVGRLLVQEVLGVLRQHGVGAVSLIASAEGAPFYQRLGFRSEARGQKAMFLILAP